MTLRGGAVAPQSTFAPLATTMSRQRTMSALMTSANSWGVEVQGTIPMSISFLLKASLLTIFTTSS